jgi:molecular chaperone HscB
MPAPDDYFARFGLDRRFELDEQALNERYQALVAQARASGGTGAAELEQAHRVLADPELRADYLLDLTGGPSARELDTIWGEQRQTIDALRQQWAEATARGDDAAKDAVRHAIAAERQARLGRVATLFRMLTGGDGPVVQRDRRRNLRMEINALRALGEIGAAGG